MRMTLRQLRVEVRRLLEFGVDTENRLSAGLFQAGGVSAGRRSRENTIMVPPPGLGGLGDEDEAAERSEREEEKGQAAVRVYDRTNGRA